MLKLLDQVHVELLECCIMLATQKLHRKVCAKVRDTTEGNEEVLGNSDEIETSPSTSKLSQSLSRLVVKYLSINGH